MHVKCEKGAHRIEDCVKNIKTRSSEYGKLNRGHIITLNMYYNQVNMIMDFKSKKKTFLFPCIK